MRFHFRTREAIHFHNPIDSERGFLNFYPADVVAVTDGKPITKSDILKNKRKRQHRELAIKRYSYKAAVKPCFIWVFFCPGIGGVFYRGWWLYVKTLKDEFNIEGRYGKFVPRIMTMFPCGYLPIIENFEPWKKSFADLYHYPTRKRPEGQGMTIAWAKISYRGNLLDIMGGHDA